MAPETHTHRIDFLYSVVVVAGTRFPYPEESLFIQTFYAFNCVYMFWSFVILSFLSEFVCFCLHIKKTFSSYHFLWLSVLTTFIIDRLSFL